MKCPKCDNEMDKGIIDESMAGWMSASSALGKMSNLGVGMVWGKDRIWAYKCAKCGKVELQTEV